MSQNISQWIRMLHISFISHPYVQNICGNVNTSVSTGATNAVPPTRKKFMGMPFSRVSAPLHPDRYFMENGRYVTYPIHCSERGAADGRTHGCGLVGIGMVAQNKRLLCTWRVSGCDPHCTSGCVTQGEGLCDSQCSTGYSLVDSTVSGETNYTCSRTSVAQAYWLLVAVVLRRNVTISEVNSDQINILQLPEKVHVAAVHETLRGDADDSPHWEGSLGKRIFS